MVVACGTRVYSCGYLVVRGVDVELSGRRAAFESPASLLALACAVAQRLGTAVASVLWASLGQ